MGISATWNRNPRRCRRTALPLGVRAKDQRDRPGPWKAVLVEPTDWRHTMAYRIQCLLCAKETWAGNVVDLLDAHTNERGRFICARCGARETYVQHITGRWEKEPDAEWDGYIKGVLRLGTDSSNYTPYIFLTARSAHGAVSGLRFSYDEDPGPTGRRTDGPGPGQAPALTLAEVVQLLEKLDTLGILDPKDLEGVASRLPRESPVAIAA